MTRKIAFTLLLFLWTVANAAAADRIESAMVKIYTVQDNPSYLNPWNTDGPQSISGSGAVISGNRIITNAHVVGNSTFIQVRANGDAKKYEAEVISISHAADLAILKAKALQFYKNIKPLQIGGLPDTRQSIVVYGFPTGGDTLSTTKGVVSRIEHQKYVHSLVQLPAIQIDAAINAGNSGGPAISDNGKIVGIAMQGYEDADNIGYLIPSLTIEHFLKDIGDGKYDGIPSLGILTQEMENPSFREKSKMASEMTGCLITKVIQGLSADGYLKEHDILLRIGGHDVADDQTIEFSSKKRTHFDFYVQQLQLGETVKLEILRDGRRQAIKIPLKSRIGEERLVEVHWDRVPTYYIYGGLVFNPLTINYLRGWSEKDDENENVSLASYLFHNWKEKKGQHIVILNTVLPADLNVGYHGIYDEIVRSVNQKPIHDMHHLIDLIEKSETEFVEIQLLSNKRIVLKKSDVIVGGEDILRRYKIQHDRSDDLRSE